MEGIKGRCWSFDGHTLRHKIPAKTLPVAVASIPSFEMIIPDDAGRGGAMVRGD